MNRVVLILLSVVCLVTGCNRVEDSIPETESELISVAKDKFREASTLTRERKNWEALSALTEAEQLYTKVTHPTEYFNKYLLLRQKALVLNREDLSGLAAQSMEKALGFLEKAEDYGHEMNYDKERVSTLKYMASYLRNDYQFQASSDIIFGMLSEEEVVKGLHAQLKERIGRNFYDLFAYDEAYTQFNDILKISDLPPNNKAQYLHDRAHAGYKLGRVDEAFQDLTRAKEIQDSLGRDLYRFVTRMDLGELYILEKDFETANTLFEEALVIGEDLNFELDPDLYKIYSLKWTASIVLRHDDAASYKRKFDSLEQVYIVNSNAYSQEIQYQQMLAKLGKSEFDRQMANTNRRKTAFIVASVVLGVLFVAVIYLMYKMFLVRRGRLNRIKNSDLNSSF